MALRHKERIIAKTPGPLFLFKNHPLNTAFKLLKNLTFPGDNHDTPKASRPLLLRDACKLCKQLSVVCRVLRTRSRITRRVDSWLPPQGINLQPGIVGENQSAGCLADRNRLEACILDKGGSRFLHLGGISNSGEVKDPEQPLQDKRYFFGFVNIPGRYQ